MIIEWNDDKNAKLKAERGVSFEDVITAMDEGRKLDEYEHPNQEKHPGQHVIVVEILNYAYIVPLVKTGTKIFLKTIIPSHKLTKRYLFQTKKIKELL